MPSSFTFSKLVADAASYCAAAVPAASTAFVLPRPTQQASSRTRVDFLLKPATQPSVKRDYELRKLASQSAHRAQTLSQRRLMIPSTGKRW
ncbi:MAG TPA: hypothetical protein VF598_06680 [Hymenobacter sp.]|jgi:hypothetical protein